MNSYQVEFQAECERVKQAVKRDIYSAIIDALEPQVYTKLDDVIITLLLKTGRHNKGIERFDRAIEDLVLSGRLVQNGNSVRLVQ